MTSATVDATPYAVITVNHTDGSPLDPDDLMVAEQPVDDHDELVGELISLYVRALGDNADCEEAELAQMSVPKLLTNLDAELKGYTVGVYWVPAQPSMFAVTAVAHPYVREWSPLCGECLELTGAAVAQARVTGSVGCTYGDGKGHSVTVTRVITATITS